MLGLLTPVWLAVFASTRAWPLDSLQSRQILNQSLVTYSLPEDSSSVSGASRAAAIKVKQETFLYGPGADGGPFSPHGSLGDTYVAAATKETGVELVAQLGVEEKDASQAKADSAKYNNLSSVDDYTRLYDGEWGPSSAPTGVSPGMLSNYTSDLLFSMSRLSFSPFVIRRLDPSADRLPFDIDDSASNKIAGSSLSDLLKDKRLFYADHRNQGNLNRTDLFAPACDAYFYLSDDSKFLPLAIRPNAGSSLVYTPLDSANDWLLAKIMYEINDFYSSQVDHLVRTHWVVEVPYQAAVRTLSDSHPLLGLMNHLMYGAFAIRPLGAATLFNKGGVFDVYFAHGGSATAGFAGQIYNTTVGNYQGNYLETDLRTRGLINCSGPALPSFPFYEDAQAIHEPLREFLTTFIDSYYADDPAVASDRELQNWVAESRDAAHSKDFPEVIQDKGRLVDVIEHFIYLCSTAHHAVNTNQLITSAGVYPLHIQALYKPVPTSKGVQNLVEFLPPLDKCIGWIEVAARFSRPLLANTKRNVISMFDDLAFLKLTNDATRSANEKFKSAMKARSLVVSSRTFDSQGLSQGMPFVWKGLDPGVIPATLTI